MTNREAFTRVKTHLLTQMAKAEGSNGCMYKTPEGLKCAIGALIPDGEYRYDFDGVSLLVVQRDCPTLEGLDYIFLRELQWIHDSRPPSQWATLLDEVEVKYRRLLD